MKRRQLLIGAGVATAVGVSGCLGFGGGDDSSDGLSLDTPGGAVESWHKSLDNGDTSQLQKTLHSESPYDVNERDNGGGGALEAVETEVIEENLDESAIQQQVGVTLPEESVSTLAEAENAVVEADVTTNIDGEELTTTTENLTAAEDGEWKFVV